MRRLFGQKPKAPKSAQASPIPTPIPVEEFRARASHTQHPPRTPPPPDEPWTLVRDDDAPTLTAERINAGLPALPLPAAAHPGTRIDPPSPPSDSYFHHQQQQQNNYSKSSSNILTQSSGVASSQQKIMKKGSLPVGPTATAILRSLDPVIANTKSRSSSPDSQPYSHEAGERRVRTNERDYDLEKYKSREYEIEQQREIAKERDLMRARELEWEWEMERNKEAVAQTEREMERERERERERDRPRRPHSSDRPKDKHRDRENKVKNIFSNSKDKDREKRSRSGEITEMIGYLTATASENWSLVLEVCDRASLNESQGREAARALRREFKYASPSAQLSAARLWAIMLQNCSANFIGYASNRKFLDAIEEVLLSGSTSPVVRERLMDVLAAAAFKHPGAPKEGYRALWKRLKPIDKPDQGIPFDEDDAMLNPSPALTKSPPPDKAPWPVIIPPHEDMRRLFEECELARGNAHLLSQALTFARPEELNGPVINEWYRKCMKSQEFIMQQIPWATAQADQSKDDMQRIHKRNIENGYIEMGPVPTSKEEELLAALLGANQDLLEAFRIFHDLERLGRAEEEEREAAERSKTDTRMDRTQIQYIAEDGSFQMDVPSQNGNKNNMPSGSAGPSRSPSPIPSGTATAGAAAAAAPPLPLPLPLPHFPNPHPPNPSPAPSPQPSHHANHTLAPPLRPSGPRPARTPSPEKLNVTSLSATHIPGTGTGHIPSSGLGFAGGVGVGPDATERFAQLTVDDRRSNRRQSSSTESGLVTPVVPSAKAMGKRKAVSTFEDVDENQSEDLTHLNGRSSETDSLNHHEDESPDGQTGAAPWRRQPVKYVYDAAADRAREMRRDLGLPSPTTNGFRLRR